MFRSKNSRTRVFDLPNIYELGENLAVYSSSASSSGWLYRLTLFSSNLKLCPVLPRCSDSAKMINPTRGESITLTRKSTTCLSSLHIIGVTLIDNQQGSAIERYQTAVFPLSTGLHFTEGQRTNVAIAQCTVRTVNQYDNLIQTTFRRIEKDVACGYPLPVSPGARRVRLLNYATAG